MDPIQPSENLCDAQITGQSILQYLLMPSRFNETSAHEHHNNVALTNGGNECRLKNHGGS